MEKDIRAFGLYVILTNPAAGYEACAEACVNAGVRFLQLRMKGIDTAEYIKTGHVIREITKGTNTIFIINDSLQTAMTVDADGLHVGQLDMSLLEARKTWAKPGKIFGLSTHNMQQAIDARILKPDYIGVGPVFPTPAKAVPDPVLGLKRMSEIISLSPIPAVAIGGINAVNLPDVLKHQAVNFASVRPVTESTCPGKAIKELMEIWRLYYQSKS